MVEPSKHKKEHPKVKTNLHPKNKHNQRYNFAELVKPNAVLQQFVKPNKFGDLSIDFFDPKAVKELNRAILFCNYGLTYWDIPQNYLCPPIPGRADYIHYLNDLLNETYNKNLPQQIRCLDIGVGANCIYPLIGNAEYGWQFVGSDIDQIAIKNAKKIVAKNSLTSKILFRHQPNINHFFKGIVEPNERYDLTICNPPFHASAAEAKFGSTQKVNNLKRRIEKKVTLNFGGQNNELWCKGGELTFIKNMILESKQFANNCLWFTTLVSKSENLNAIYFALKQQQAVEVKTVKMAQGSKVSRFVAWTFLSKSQQAKWISNLKVLLN